jgi:uncharacterized membrane protein YoaK (UPF0700 family)
MLNVMLPACLLSIVAGYADAVGYLRYDAFAGLMTEIAKLTADPELKNVLMTMAQEWLKVACVRHVQN